MNATITLDLIGTSTGSFNIYQNSDSYATAVATGVSSSSLLSGYSATLDNATTTVRVYSTGTCTNYKDIPVNFGDTTPTFSYRGLQTLNSATGVSDTNIVHDGDQTVIASANNVGVYVSTNLGTSWTDVTNQMPTNDFSMQIYSPSDDYFYFMGYGGAQTKYQNGGSFSSHSNNISLPGSETIWGYFYHNNAYYVATTSSLLRSTDNVNYTTVFNLTYSSYKFLLDHLKGYGNTVYFSTGKEIIKSTDNGLNWSSLYGTSTANAVDNIYVENANKVLYRDSGGSRFYYTTNGSTFFQSGFRTTTSGNLNNAATIIKYGPTYIFNNHTYDLVWTTSDPFSSTTPTVNNISSSVQVLTPPATNALRTNVFHAAIVGKRLFYSGFLNTSSTDSTNLVYFDINSN